MQLMNLRALGILAALMPWSFAANADLTLTVTPRFSPDAQLKQITPLAKRLSEALGERVEVVLSSNFKDMQQRVATGQVDIACISPGLYVNASNAHEAVAILSQGAGGTKLRGVVITRADSDIFSANDLKGRTVTAVAYASPGGYLSQKVALEKRGINPQKDMKLSEAKDNKAENAMLSVYLGDSEAAFMREDAMHSADRFVPPSQIRVVMTGEWFPNWALSVKRTLPQEVKDKIRQAVLSMEPGGPELKALKAQGFAAGGDEDYDIYRKALGLPIPAR